AVRVDMLAEPVRADLRSGQSPGDAAVLTIYRDSSGLLRSSDAQELPSEVIWIDLLNPIEDEKAYVESRAPVRIPSFEALSEIESSSRLIVEGGVIYLSTPVV